MYDVKLGGKIFRGVRAIKMDKETGDTVVFGNLDTVYAECFDESAVLDFRKVDFAESYTTE